MIGKFLGAVVLIVATLGLLVVTWPQLLSLQRVDVVAQAVAMRGLVVALALGATVIFTLLALLVRPMRRFAASLAVVCLVFAGIGAAVLASRGTGGPGFPAATESDVTVLAWNTLGGAPGARVVAQLAVDTNADVVSLPETTRDQGQAIAAEMAALGAPMQAFTVAYDEISPARSTTILISDSLGQYTVDEAQETTTVLPSVVAVPANGDGPIFVAVHAVAPIPGEMQNWQDDLQWLAGVCTGNTILAGDFNSTLDNYTGLAANVTAALGECVDSAQAVGSAAVGTWPTSAPALLGSPIDHVMATPTWTTTGMRVIGSHDGHGSDHRPVLAQLTPAS